MGCILRAHGRQFDVDACVKRLGLEPEKVYRRGELRLRTRPGGKRNQYAGFNLVVSNADFDALVRQIGDARRFLKRRSSIVRRVRRWPGVDGIGLDFGVRWKPDAVVQSTGLPEDLVTLAGRLGLSLEVTMYPSSDQRSSPPRRSRGSGKRRPTTA